MKDIEKLINYLKWVEEHEGAVTEDENCMLKFTVDISSVPEEIVKQVERINKSRKDEDERWEEYEKLGLLD